MSEKRWRHARENGNTFAAGMLAAWANLPAEERLAEVTSELDNIDRQLADAKAKRLHLNAVHRRLVEERNALQRTTAREE